jgi:hypothetical protein
MHSQLQKRLFAIMLHLERPYLQRTVLACIHQLLTMPAMVWRIW